MKPFLIPPETPEDVPRGWAIDRAIEENNVLVAAHIRTWGDQLLGMYNSDPHKMVFLSVEEFAKMLDFLANEIEIKRKHEHGNRDRSARITYELLMKCFGKRLDDIQPHS